MPEITITYKKWTIPDYRRGETEKDSRLIKLELESDIVSTNRFSVDMDGEDVICALETVQGIIEAAIEKEKELLKKESK